MNQLRLRHIRARSPCRRNAGPSAVAWACGAALLLAGVTSPHAARADTLPYTERTQSYSAMPSTVHGDIRTVGMAGATFGLADSFLASLDNPAGLAMTIPPADLKLLSNEVRDGNVQAFNNTLTSYDIGLALRLGRWGFSVGYVSPYAEGHTYDLLTGPNHTAAPYVTTRELRFAVARIFLHDRLAVGASLNLGQSATSLPPGFAHDSYAIGATVGVSYRLPLRLILGAGLTTPMSYAGSTEAGQGAPIAGFFQPVNAPWHGGLGIGWLQNRFLRADFSLSIIGGSRGAALLGNNSAVFSSAVTVQPHLGVGYSFLDFKQLKANVFVGGYYEPSRVEGLSSRTHATAGMEISMWGGQLGAAIDRSSNYTNFILGIGVDVIDLMCDLRLLPRSTKHDSGFLPKPLIDSDVGLPPAFVTSANTDGDNVDILKVGLAMPGIIADDIRSVRDVGFVKSAQQAARAFPQAWIDEGKDMKTEQAQGRNEQPTFPAPPTVHPPEAPPTEPGHRDCGQRPCPPSRDVPPATTKGSPPEADP